MLTQKRAEAAGGIWRTCGSGAPSRLGTLAGADFREWTKSAARGKQAATLDDLKSPDGELLAELALAHGVTISDIAAALHVRVAEVRGGGNGQATVPTESLHALSDFAAFVGRLATVVDSPGRWLSAPLVAGFNVTALDVYTRDRAAILQQRRPVLANSPQLACSTTWHLGGVSSGAAGTGCSPLPMVNCRCSRALDAAADRT